MTSWSTAEAATEVPTYTPGTPVVNIPMVVSVAARSYHFRRLTLADVRGVHSVGARFHPVLTGVEVASRA